MKERRLILEQLDNRIIRYKALDDIVMPAYGWVYSIRKALNMSLRQLGRKMSITPQSVKKLEEREKNGSVSLNVLRQVGLALDMKFVYGFIPRHYTLQKMIEKRAEELAMEIVHRTSVSMNLEDQKPNDARLKKAISEKAEEFNRNIPKYLWD